MTVPEHAVLQERLVLAEAIEILCNRKKSHRPQKVLAAADSSSEWRKLAVQGFVLSSLLVALMGEAPPVPDYQHQIREFAQKFLGVPADDRCWVMYCWIHGNVRTRRQVEELFVRAVSLEIAWSTGRGKHASLAADGPGGTSMYLSTVWSFGLLYRLDEGNRNWISGSAWTVVLHLEINQRGNRKSFSLLFSAQSIVALVSWRQGGGV